VKKRLNSATVAVYGLFIAFIAICAQINIPTQPIQITLGVFAVLAAGGLLGAKRAAAAVALYVLLGAFGAPVFGYFRGGLGVLLGPTGGYLIGYIPMAFAVGFLSELLRKKTGESYFVYIPSMAAGVIICYIFGTAWFVISTKSTVAAALAVCVIPFIPGDVIKIISAALFVYKLRPRLSAQLRQFD
jgi:biotin transport system substrate-specific component